MSKSTNKEFISLFRQSAPYINKFRNNTFVIVFNGETVESQDFPNLIHDFALLDSLGIRLVLVYGARPQIEACLAQKGQRFQYHNNVRISDDTAMQCVMESVACIRLKIEALLSMGLANSPMAGAQLRVSSGNFITARPYGIRDGIDYQHTGEIRKLDTDAIENQLRNGSIVLLSPLGYSPTGEIFNLLAEDVARASATALKADKLIYLAESDLNQQNSSNIREMSVTQAEHMLKRENTLDMESRTILENAIDVCRAHVGRVHILDRNQEGVLLQELFTRDGIGTLISADPYDQSRRAVNEDIPGILELIEPLEKKGILVGRSRETLETQIDQYYVMERDKTIIACGALFQFQEKDCAELACFAVHPDYQNQGKGDRFLNYLEALVRQNNVHHLFVLSTHTAHWFQERGFEQICVDDLPLEKKRLYNYKRNSKSFSKKL